MQLFVHSFTHSCVVTECFPHRRRFTGSWTHGTQRCGHRLARADRGVMVLGRGGYTDHCSSREGGSGGGQHQGKGKGGETGFPDISQFS